MFQISFVVTFANESESFPDIKYVCLSKSPVETFVFFWPCLEVHATFYYFIFSLELRVLVN